MSEMEYTRYPEPCGRERTKCPYQYPILVAGKGIDRIKRILRTDVNSVLATTSEAATFSQAGRLFAARAAFGLQSAFRNAELVITNPAGSGRVAFIDTVYGGGFISPVTQALSYKSGFTILILRDSAPGTGTTPTIQSMNYGSTATSAMSATGGTNQIGGVRILETGGYNNFTLDFGGKIILPPGHSFAVRIETEIPADFFVSALSATWYEVDIPD